MEIYIVGCGGNGKIVVDICELNKYHIMGIFDDKYDGNIIYTYKNYQVIGKISDIPKYGKINIINSIGDNHIRKKICESIPSCELNWINCVHPNSYVVDNAKIGIGNIICYGAFINSDASVGNFNLINTNAIIEHDCIIGDFNHLAPRSTLCGGITIGNINLLGAATTIIPCKKIGDKNIIGAQTLIINNFNDSNLIVGVPGKNKYHN